jgi:DNA replication initiation complex subunit (GINS family)
MKALAPQPVRLTPEEKRLYGQLFRIADAAQVGVISSADAVAFFKKSRLTLRTIAEVISPPPRSTIQRLIIRNRYGRSQIPMSRGF